METTANADLALNALWRNADDGRGILLRIAPAGLDALGIEPGRRRRPKPRSGSERADRLTNLAESPRRGDGPSPAASDSAPLPGKTREGTKQALLIDMLSRTEGASLCPQAPSAISR